MNENKQKGEELFCAMVSGILLQSFLGARTLCRSREALTVSVPAVLFLFGSCVLAWWGWSLCGKWLICRMLMSVLLLWSAAIQLLQLWDLMQYAYPNTILFGGLFAMIAVPVLYLRRKKSVARTGNVILVLLLAGFALLSGSLWGRLRVENLQAGGGTAFSIEYAFWKQSGWLPEFFFPALFCEDFQQGVPWRSRRLTLGLPFAAVSGGTACALLTELLYGAAALTVEKPLHAAAKIGTISVFGRLEWIQLLLWFMATTLRLGLFLLAINQLWISEARQAEPVSLLRSALTAAVVWVLCRALQRKDISMLLLYQNAAYRASTVFIVLGGALAWLFKRRKAPKHA